MHLKLNSGIVAKGFQGETGDVVDWKNDEEAKRLIERGLAKVASREEIQAAAGKVRSYEPPKPRPEDRWPPGQLKNLELQDAP